MKGRETKRAPSADLLVCFPSRAHLTLMPKPICSPARPSDSNKPHQNHHHHHLQNHRRHLKKSSSRLGGSRASPLLWAKTKQMGSEISEPTSPKVTCAGQIKVRHKASSCKNWQSVMEEIEKIHNSRKHNKKSSWIDSLGFKKDVMQFLTCLRNIRFDFRCFGSFPAQSDITSDDDEDEEEEYVECPEKHLAVEGRSDNEDSRTIFSKWFMVLQENQNGTTGIFKEETEERERSCNDEPLAAPTVPPPNALLLMRCRSAPAKSWQEEEEEEEEEEQRDDQEEEDEEKEDRKKGKNLKASMEEETVKSKNDNLVVMSYDTDFYKLSTEIANETWVVGGMIDPLSRSRSWKR